MVGGGPAFQFLLSGSDIHPLDQPGDDQVLRAPPLPSGRLPGDFRNGNDHSSFPSDIEEFSTFGYNRTVLMQEADFIRDPLRHKEEKP